MQIAAPAPAGGLEQVVQALALGHHRRGHDVALAAIIVAGQPTHPLVATLEGAGVKVYRVTVGPRSYADERRQIERCCLDFRPDVVHTHGYRIDVVERGVVARLGLPTVTTVHGPSMIGGLKGAFYEWLQRRSYRRFDAVVAVSRALHESTLRDGVRPDRLHLIRNAWGGLYDPVPRAEARRLLDLDPDEPVIGWVGRMIPVKGGDVFLDAVARLDPPRPTIVMIGHGIEHDALRERAARAGIADRVRIHSNILEAGRLFTAFDTYVLSSRSEGLPIVILEAMAAGTPIVASAIGGIPDALGDAEAWLVPPGEPQPLADAIAESLRDRAAALSRAAAARHRLETEFSVESWLVRYEEVYQGLRTPAGRSSTVHPALA